jgi:hypothetical protein
VALVNAYATVAQFRTHMGDTGSTLNTELIERALNSTSRAIERWCGRKFWLDAQVTIRYYRPDLPDIAWVDDIGTITGLVIATDTTGDGSFATTWASTDYELGPLNADTQGDATAYAWTWIEAVDRYLFPVGARRKPLKVTARHGWSANPADVEEACLIKSSSLFERRKSPLGLASGISEFGVVRISRSDPDVLGLLHPFVKLGLGAV